MCPGRSEVLLGSTPLFLAFWGNNYPSGWSWAKEAPKVYPVSIEKKLGSFFQNLRKTLCKHNRMLCKIFFKKSMLGAALGYSRELGFSRAY